MYNEEHIYSIALRQCKLIGDIIFNKLVRKFGSAKTVWEISKRELSNTEGIGSKIIADIGNKDHLLFAEKEILFCEKNSIKINLRHENKFPALLNQCDDAPAILYQKGNFNNDLLPISIVGTRNITLYGKKFIEDFFHETKGFTFQTVSGLALGADKEVHDLSLQHNIPTVAVLAHGFHTLYPSKNKLLAEKILQENGTLFTEFNSSRKPDRENFIQRNRIVAGISPATIIVETAFGGGSISTATFANNYNREVYALPGKITDKYSQGCNHLIVHNKASSISTIKDLVDQLNIKPSERTDELFPISENEKELSDNQNTIYQLILKYPSINLDELAEKAVFSSHKILPILLELELLGKIKSFSGRQFIAI